MPLQASSSFKWYFFKGGIKFLLLKYMHCMGNPSLWKHFHKVYAKKFFWEILFIRLLLSLAFPRKWIHFSQFLLTWSSECNWMIFKSNYQFFKGMILHWNAFLLIRNYKRSFVGEMISRNRVKRCWSWLEVLFS